MSDAMPAQPNSDDSRSAAPPELPDELPPVEPPSAGFIIQLFVVPGLIVLAVVGVWALFGQLAAGEQDWQSLVAELSNSNEHRRWRGAHGLAQMMQADQEREASEQTLARNPLVIDKLTALFQRELERTAPSADDLTFQAFLARTMGLLESREKVIPVLRQAMQPEHDREVRKNSVAAVAVIAGRVRERGRPLEGAALTADLIDVSADADPLMRQVAAFTLGLVEGEAGRGRLRVLLDDPDENTRLNAAISLSRNGSTAGLKVFKAVLTGATSPVDVSGLPTADPAQRQQQINNLEYQRDIRLLNTLHAVESLKETLSPAERQAMGDLLQAMSESSEVERQFRQRADLVRKSLNAG